MGFYGKVNRTDSNFVIDVTYGNRAEMEDALLKGDGVFIGRYVLVDYNKGTAIEDNYVRLYDKLEVFKDGEKSEANFMDVANAGNGVVKTPNGGKVKFWSGTQQEYDAITTKDANTLYIIS